MYTRFSSIINSLRCLVRPTNHSKQVKKILRMLPKLCASKVDVITKAKDLKVLIMDALIGNIRTHKVNRENDVTKKDKSLALKLTEGEESKENDDQMAYITKRF